MKDFASRRRRSFRLVPTLLFTLGLAAAGVTAAAPRAAAQRMQDGADALLSDTDAYLLLPPELISGPVVDQASVSPLGRNVAVVRKLTRLSAENLPSSNNPRPQPPHEELELLFWNAGTRRPITLWQSARMITSVRLSEWMPGTESLFAMADRLVLPNPQAPPNQRPVHEFKLMLLGLGIDRAVQIPLPDGVFDQIDVSVSPVQPIAVVHLFTYEPRRPDVYFIVHKNGRVGAAIQAPESFHQLPTWDEAGNPVLSELEKDGNPMRYVLRRVFRSVDLRTGQTQLLPAEPKLYQLRPQPAARLPFHVTTRKQELTQGESTEAVHPIWLDTGLKNEKPRAMITPDGQALSLLSDGSGLIFKGESALWFAPVLKINKVEYLAMRAAARRVVAISNAKQLALAALMFAQDNDEALPGPEGINDILLPYLKNDQLFAGFSYTFPGSTLADISSPAETVLGYVSTADGHAVMYADGHVKWSTQRPGGK